MVSVSFMAPGEASAVPAAAVARRIRARELPRLVRDLRHRPLFPQQPARRDLAHVLSLAFIVPAGYAFAKLKFKGRDAHLPSAGRGAGHPRPGRDAALVPELKEMGLINSFAGVLVPWLAGIFGIFLVRQYALSIPDELLEAARIDGASEGASSCQDRRPRADPDAGHAGPVHLPRRVERLHVAADHFDRPGKYTLPVALAALSPRACPGQ